MEGRTSCSHDAQEIPVGIAVSFFEVVAAQVTRLCVTSRQQAVSFHSPNIPSAINNSRRCSFNAVLRCVPVVSTSCNLCPKSITRDNFHLSVSRAAALLFRARKRSSFSRESSRGRARCITPQKIYTYPHSRRNTRRIARESCVTFEIAARNCRRARKRQAPRRRRIRLSHVATIRRANKRLVKARLMVPKKRDRGMPL